MPPIEKPLIVGRKAILAFLQTDNWESVLRMKNESGLPIGKPAGRWVAKRVNLQSWLDQKTNCTTFHETEQRRAVEVLERVETLLTDITRLQRGNRRALWQKAKKRRQILNLI